MYIAQVKSQIFKMHTKSSFFQFHVLEKNFLSNFIVRDPEIRDPRPRLPYNGPII